MSLFVLINIITLLHVSHSFISALKNKMPCLLECLCQIEELQGELKDLKEGEKERQKK